MEQSGLQGTFIAPHVPHEGPTPLVSGWVARGLLLSGFGGGPGFRFFHQLLDFRAAQDDPLAVDLVP
jgi:hypothetical protein